MASAGIRDHIANLNYSAIFTTRDVLKYGKRNAVDQCLHFLVKSGEIRRLARGVFVQDPNINPSIEQIAEIKAAAFGKRIYKYATNVLNQIARFPQEDPNKGQYGKTFAINGDSSGFETFRGPVKYKGIAQRKAKLCESSIGEKVHALWHLGSDEHIEKAVRFVFRNLNRAERANLRSCSSLMPAWLNDMFIDRFARILAS
ncbi:MAG TPA: type IV toxin-antitoxin system AbiEi family antitoxin domain-containing protein [Oculatellaceae cyanobacterium]